MRLYKLLLCLALSGVIPISPAQARDQIRIVGSGTLYPFVTAVAEQFGEDETYKTPIVESTGTGGGFKLFCEGTGKQTPDIADASRRMAASEQALCRSHGVTDIGEIPVGYDGIVLARKKNALSVNLTKQQLFMALARRLPDSQGTLIDNPNRRWSDIDPKLPAQPIKIYGPGTVSGTRDAFVELVMEKACEAFPVFATRYADPLERKKNCQSLREDGVYIESGENYNILVQKLVGDDTALGIMGYSFYSLNAAKIQASAINGVMPERKTIASGDYAISRPLYMYVKKQHIGLVPGIPDFMSEMTSEYAVGEEGYVTDKGLIPLSAQDREAARNALTESALP